MPRSQALIEAQRRYYENKRSKTQKTISVTLTAEQAAQDRARIAAAGLTVAGFWRAAVDRLPPLPEAEDKPKED